MYSVQEKVLSLSPFTLHIAICFSTQQRRDGYFNQSVVISVARTWAKFYHFVHTVLSCILSYLLYSMECVRCLQSNGCRDMYLKRDGLKNMHAFHAQPMLWSWMISVTHAQWTSEPPLPLLLNDLYYWRISDTFHTFYTSNQCQMLRA